MDDGYINYIIWDDMDAGEYVNNGMGYVSTTLSGTRPWLQHGESPIYEENWQFQWNIGQCSPYQW